jgi:hypothetical protein
LDQGLDTEDEEYSTGVFVKEILASQYLSLGKIMRPSPDDPHAVGVADGKKDGKKKGNPQHEGYSQVVFIVYAHSDTTINLDAEVLYPDGKANSFFVWMDERASRQLSAYKAPYVTEYSRRMVSSLPGGEEQPVEFQLTQGLHTLHFGCREDGTYLRKVWITAGDADFIEGSAAFTLAHEGKICLSKSGGFRYARWEHGCQGECDADGDGPGPCNLQCCRETCAAYDWCTHFTWFTNDACRLYDKCDAVVDGSEGATHEKIYEKLKATVDLVPDSYTLPTLLLE